MFAGIIEEIGIVKELIKRENLSVLRVLSKAISPRAKLGDSIAVSGVCLTIADIKKNILSFDMMRETLDKTSLGSLKAGAQVNLERALKADGRIDGHFVTGHVDQVSVVKKLIVKKNYLEVQIRLDKELEPYVVSKGSICIDGISLTIGEVKKDFFSVHLIPFTLKNTTMGTKKAGDQVNIETDILAKYILQASKVRGR